VTDNQLTTRVLRELADILAHPDLIAWYYYMTDDGEKRIPSILDTLSNLEHLLRQRAAVLLAEVPERPEPIGIDLD
jgi:hypothetical protein